ncbi:hypothetical protein B566_EDAN004153, partial [Ephemera danica]
MADEKKSTSASEPVEKSEILTKLIVEHGVELCVDKSSITPKHSDCYYDVNSKLIRAMITATLTAYCETDAPVFWPVRCLEGLGATGVCGLTWAKHLDAKVAVTVNAVSERAARRIEENAERNSLKINVASLESRTMLQQNPYSFIVLESFANSSAYLDSALVCLPRGGVLVLSTTDDPALYCKVPEVALRKYGGRLGKTKYYREMAARLVVASIARSAARYDKGVRVLWCYSNKGHLTVVIQV